MFLPLSVSPSVPEDFGFFRHDVVHQSVNVGGLDRWVPLRVLDAALLEREGVHQDLDLAVHDSAERISFGIFSRCQGPVLNQEERYLVALGGQVRSQAVEIGNVAGLERVALFNQKIVSHSPPLFVVSIIDA